MKIRLIIIYLCFAIALPIQSQIHIQDMSNETKQFFFAAKDCWENTEETCIPFYKKFVASAKAKNECVPCAEIELARGYYFENYLDSSFTHINNVLKKTPKLKDTLQLRIELDSYNLLGAIYTQKGKQEKAIESYIACGKRIDKLNLKEHAALLNVNLGLLYLNMDDFDKATSLFKSALKTLDKLNITRQTAIINRNLALSYLGNDQIDSMLQILPKTLKLAKAQKSINSEIGVYSLYAEAYETKYPDSAIYYANKAIQLAQTSNRPHEKAGALFSKANVLNNQGKYKQAKPLYISSIELYKNTSRKSVIRRIYRALGKTAHYNSDFETASKYLNLYVQVNDSIAGKQTQKTVRELNTKYETEKKERQLAEKQLEIQQQKNKKQTAIFIGLLIAVLALVAYIFIRKSYKSKLKQVKQEKENAILNAFIHGEERERNRISHELHDGVAAMIGAAKMNLETFPHLPKEAQKKQLQKINQILENTHADVRHMAHNLLPITLQKEGLVYATKQFVSEINQTRLLDIEVIDNNSEANQLSKKLQLMLFRIIQELVNNIIKHSQAEKATITFSQKEGILQLEVIDNGIGFNEESKTKTSQGLYSISQRLRSIGGNFKITQKRDSQGTQAIAKLKLKTQ